MSDYTPYRVKIDPLPLKGSWSATFMDRSSGEAVGNISFGASTKDAAKHFAMGYCTAFFRMSLPVKFDTAGGS